MCTYISPCSVQLMMAMVLEGVEDELDGWQVSKDIHAIDALLAQGGCAKHHINC